MRFAVTFEEGMDHRTFLLDKQHFYWLMALIKDLPTKSQSGKLEDKK